ncbi:MAG: esterase-like activity of phytase family protein [Acidimicrobiia bacterium]
MRSVRTRFGAALAAMTLGASALVITGGTANALSNPPAPQLAFSTLIPSHPWPTGSLTGVNANDIEGLVSVPSNNSIWVADDNRDRIYEIDASTGGLKSQILANAFQTTATQVGTGQLCSDPAQLDPGIPSDTGAFECLSRTDDFESLAYDPTGDVLYVTSGGCCSAGLPAGYQKHPTIWKLTRSGSTFVPSQWQALPETEDPTAAGWRPGAGMYYGKNNFVRTYDFATNALGSKITAPSYLVGVDFIDATNVFITTATPNPSTGRTTATSDSTITKYTFSGSSFTAVPGWTFPLKNTGMIDARDMTLINDTFYVSDGYDFRTGSEFNCVRPGSPPGTTCPAGDHIIYEYTLGSAPALTAGYAWGQQTSTAPYTVQFFDATTPANSITSPARTWAWDFDGNGTTDSTLQNPAAGFNGTGTYPVKLTVTNAAGPFTITKQVKVTAGVVPPGPAWRYEALNGSGSGVTNRHFGDGNTLLKFGTQLHGFYRDTTNSSLAHSWWDGTRWNTETLDGTGSTTAGHTGNDVGANVASIVYNGQLQLFYGDATTGKLRHAWWDGARWNFESFDTKSAGSGTIAVRQYGTQLHLFYANDTDHRLRHAWWDGARWNYENLDTATTPSGLTSIDASKYGATLQVVYKTSGNALRHTWWDGARWNAETLDGSGSTTAGHTNNSVGDYATLQSFGSQLDILYRNATTNGLRHAWWNGTRWSFEQLDGSGGVIPGHTGNSVGTYIAAMQYAGGLHVWYRDLTSGALRHAWYAGGWHVEVLDGAGATYSGASNSNNTGRFTALVDYGGQIHLTYLDAGNSDRFAHTWYG